ncbi:unnamed protein product [Effrenium voratum]|nr:unnamed protein product [Effrenium voratum]
MSSAGLPQLASAGREALVLAAVDNLPAQSYCIIHPGSQHDAKFVFDSTWVKIEVPSSDSSGDPYETGNSGTGTAESDLINFDYVFPPKTSQEKVFQDVARSDVRKSLESFQSAIFIASGASGSGKTFAVTGGAQRFSDRGLIPRSVSALFEALAGQPDREEIEVSVSFYELYKDAVIDLLSERRRKVPVKATENGPQLVGLLRQVVATESDAYHLLFQGDSNRHFQSFAQNSETSRGHVFYLVHIAHRTTGQRAVLAFVDLAATIAVRNPANTAIAQSLDALKATLLALRDGREAFWESSILPQLLEPWLSPGSKSTIVLLSPVRFSSDVHQEAHEWLTFTRLAQEACCGKPLHSPLQANWSKKGLQVPASFQEGAETTDAKPTGEANKNEGVEGPRIEGAQTPPQTLGKVLHAGSYQPQVSGAVTPPAPNPQEVVSPVVGSRTPVMVNRVASPCRSAPRPVQAFTLPEASMIQRPASPTRALVPQVASPQASPPRNLSPLRHAALQVQPLSPPAQCRDGHSLAQPQQQHPGQHAMSRPSALAVQQQQAELQQLQQSLRPGGQRSGNETPLAARPASPLGAQRPMRSLSPGAARPGPETQALAAANAVPQRMVVRSTSPLVCAARESPLQMRRPESPMVPPPHMGPVYMMPVSPQRVPRAFGGPLLAPGGPRQQTMPMQPGMRPGMQPCMQPGIRPGMQPCIQPGMSQVPTAFMVAPSFVRMAPAPQAQATTPRSAAMRESDAKRSVSPVPAGTMERVVRGARQESK